jgi:cell division protein FtsW
MQKKLDHLVFGDEGLGEVPFVTRWWRSVDKISIVCVICLCLIGLLLGMASSAVLAERHNLDDFYFVQRQAIFCGASVAIMLGISMMSEILLRRVALLGLLFGLIAITLLPLFGTDFSKGATRWYSVAGMSIQPSEFLKPFFSVAVGGMMAMLSRPGFFSGVHMSAIVTGFIMALLAIQPDFGQAALIFSCWFLMYLVSGSSLLGLIGLVCLTAFGGVIAYTNSDHFAGRINSYLSEDVDPNTQIGYSIRAIENGGMFGAGVGEGSVKFALPDAHTDFIVAVAAEEYGFVMVLAIISLYLVIVMRSFIRLMLDGSHARRIIGSGLVGLLGMQALINIGVSVKFFPAKGMTLPFVSYGGSSALAVGITVGLLFAFTRQCEPNTE